MAQQAPFKFDVAISLGSSHLDHGFHEPRVSGEIDRELAEVIVKSSQFIIENDLWEIVKDVDGLHFTDDVVENYAPTGEKRDLDEEVIEVPAIHISGETFQIETNISGDENFKLVFRSIKTKDLAEHFGIPFESEARVHSQSQSQSPKG